MGVLHPLRGSEDCVQMTPSQRMTLRWMVDAHDQVTHRLRRDGTLHVETVDYLEDGHTENCHVIGRDGIVF